MRRWHRINRWQNWVGLLLILFFVFGALAAPWLSPMDSKNPSAFQKVGPNKLVSSPLPPSKYALFGTLPNQYDVFHALIWGARDALVFGLIVALAAGVFGTIIGAIAGYSGGLYNGLIMRFADAFLAFPAIAGLVFLRQLVATAVQAGGGTYIFNAQFTGAFVDIVGTPSLTQRLLMSVNPLMLTLILFTWMPYARLINSMVISIRNLDFVQASRALGASPLRTIFRHLVPNSVGPAVVLMARDVGSVVLLQATLTFIHIGGDSYWGDMLALAHDWIIGPGGSIFTYWWTFIPATLALVLFGIGWNLLGDALNDWLDPYSH